MGKHSCTVLCKRFLNCFPVCVQLKAKHKHGTTYDLMANIVHDGSPEKGSYKVSHPPSLSPYMRYIRILTLIVYHIRILTLILYHKRILTLILYHIRI
jgi:hypothetical protein